MKEVRDPIAPDVVKRFLVEKFSRELEALGHNLAAVPDDFDFLLSGAIDSFGVIEMISAIETEFNVELDLGALDAEQLTILKPLSDYVAVHARRR